MKICRSDCVKIENLPDYATEDTITVAFANKALVKGEVTRVVRSSEERNTAFVYFDDYRGMTIADRISYFKIHMQD